jgi:hypothetical protein
MIKFYPFLILTGRKLTLFFVVELMAFEKYNIADMLISLTYKQLRKKCIYQLNKWQKNKKNRLPCGLGHWLLTNKNQHHWLGLDPCYTSQISSVKDSRHLCIHRWMVSLVSLLYMIVWLSYPIGAVWSYGCWIYNYLVCNLCPS